jgi:hypothetical protein
MLPRQNTKPPPPPPPPLLGSKTLTTECMHIKALQTEHEELKNKEKARQRIIKATGAENIHLYHLAFENF